MVCMASVIKGHSGWRGMSALCEYRLPAQLKIVTGNILASYDHDATRRLRCHAVGPHDAVGKGAGHEVEDLDSCVGRLHVSGLVASVTFMPEKPVPSWAGAARVSSTNSVQHHGVTFSKV